MRPGAFRRPITAAPLLLCAVLLLGGCASAAKRQYLRHLSVTIAPSAAPPAVAAAPASGPALATAESNQPRN